MELQKSSVKLPLIRLTQQPILRKTHFARLGWIITSRKNMCKKYGRTCFSRELPFTDDSQMRESEKLFSLSHIFWLDSKWKTKCYFECFYLVEWERCLYCYGKAKKFLLRLRKNMECSTPHFFQIPKLFIASGACPEESVLSFIVNNIW